MEQLATFLNSWLTRPAAADAAHLCNPFGGLGLTGGIVDVGGLSQCLIGIAQGKTTDSILDKYDEVRRKIWHELINPVSSANFIRVSSDPDVVADTDELIVMSRKAWEDPSVLEQQHAFAYALCHDFSQYFDVHPSSEQTTTSKDITSASHAAAIPVV